jgi:hypothetical protein
LVHRASETKCETKYETKLGIVFGIVFEHSSIPSMSAAMQTLYWEVARKNRLVFVTLGVLFVTAGIAVRIAGSASPEAEWAGTVRALIGVAFFTSILLCLGSFGPGESAGGGRIRSTTGRLFVLPVSTAGLVLPPLIAGSGLLTLLVLVWQPVLNRLAAGLDPVYTSAVLVAGSAVIQALGWLLPRRPGQQIGAFAILCPLMLLLAVVPQDRSGQEDLRRGLLAALAGLTLVAAGVAWYAAERNRCGDWSGGLPLDRLGQWLRGETSTGSYQARAFRSVAGALFHSECRPPLRVLLMCWMGIVVVVLAVATFTFCERPRGPWTLGRVLAHATLDVLPVLSVPALCFWGLLGSGEPSTLFRTRLPAFRATLPLGCGTLSGLRIGTIALGWALVGVPLLVLGLVLPHWGAWAARDFGPGSYGMMVFLMAVGAQVAVGALPAILTGRFEGFNNLFLAGLCSWAWPWLTLRSAQPEEGDGWNLALLGLLLAVKAVAAVVAFGLALRRRLVTGGFVAGVTLGWLLVAGLLAWAAWFGRGHETGWAATILVLIPIARLAACPLAVAANRHR